MSQEIRKNLHDVKEALNEQKRSDPARTDQAEELQKNIDSFLEQSDEISEEEHVNMLQKLKHSVEQFEASHPTLGLMFEKFLDTLSNMGI